MYLLTGQEQELAMWIANSQKITETCRGYDLFRTSPDSMPMDFSEVTNTFCPTQRRLYVSKVLGIPSKTSKSMAMGSIEHASIALVFNKVRIARSEGRKISEVADELESIAFDDDSIIAALWSDNDLESIEKYCVDGGFSYQDALPEFVDVAKQFIRMEANRLRRLGPLVDAFPDIIAIEEFVDGSSLGMNKGKIDSLIRLPDGTIMICDMKRSSYKDNMDGKTQIAGYAMALEKEYHVPISVGCLVFSSTLTDNGNEPKREIFGLDDKLRTDFISRRDNAIKIALGQYLPSFPSNADWKCKNCEAREPCYSIPPNGMPNG